MLEKKELKTTGYKGFNEKFKCRDFQYKTNSEYTTNDAILCKSGFHFCENPIDVFRYYPPASSRYCLIEADEVDGRRDNDSKRCSKKIRIGVEIGIKGIIDAFIKYTFGKIDLENRTASSTGCRSATTNSGDKSLATSTGAWGAATSTGKDSIAYSSGDKGKASGALGCGICLAERDDDGKLFAIKAAIVDGEIIKADAFYRLENGEFVECE